MTDATRDMNWFMFFFRWLFFGGDKRWAVIYTDDQMTRKMPLDEAANLKKIFGGKVVYRG